MSDTLDSPSSSATQRSRFECDTCGRAFVKAENLARHNKRSHNNEKPFRCLLCQRDFSRQDSLRRHQVLHQNPASSSRPRHHGSVDPEVIRNERRSVEAEVETSPMTSDRGIRSTQNADRRPEATPSASTAGQGSGLLNNSITAASKDRGTSDQSPLHASIGSRDISHSLRPDLDMHRHAQHGQLSSTTLNTDPTADPVYAFPHQAMENVGFSQQELDIWNLLTNDLLPSFPSVAQPFDNPFQAEAYSMLDSSMPYQTTGMNASNRTLLLSPDMNGSKYGRSQAASPLEPSGEGLEALTAAKTMLSDLSTSVTSDVSTLSGSFLDLCLQMFWTRFLPTFPIIHPATFDMHTTSAPLLINMVAIGALFTHKPEARTKSEALWRLVHKLVAGSWDRLIHLRGPYDEYAGVQLLLTALLGQVYSAMSDKPDVAQTAAVWHGIGHRWAKAAGMFERKATQIPTVEYPQDPVQLDREWRRWAADETRRRSILGYYVLDGWLATLLDTLPSIRHLYNPLPTATDDAAFFASTAADWQLEHHRSMSVCPDATFHQVYQALFNGHLDSLCMPAVARSAVTCDAVLEGLCSMVTEWRNANNGLAFGAPTSITIATGLLNFYKAFLGEQTRQFVLLIRWHVICAVFAESVARGCNDSEAWRDTPPYRRAILHANAVRQIAEEYPVPAAKVPPIGLPVSIYTAARMLVEYLRHATTRSRSNIPRNTMPYRLESRVDWTALGLETFVGDPMGGTGELGEYVLQGGTLILNGCPFGMQHMYPFTILLNAFGNAWPRSTMMARDIQTLML